MIAPRISIVVPLKDEAENIEPLVAEVTAVMAPRGEAYELILVDDGSTDGTFAALARVQAGDPRVRVVRFTQNFGQTSAFAAGFAYARGELIVTLDGDLQNDPADIPMLLDVARQHDIVVGWRRRRHDAFLTKQLPSMAANGLLSIVTGVKLHDNGCSLKVFRAEVVKPLKLRPGMHRYLPALANQLGHGRVAEVVVNHRPRRHGQSKYGLSRTFRVVLDIVQMPALKRRAVAGGPMPRIYEVAEVLETVG